MSIPYNVLMQAQKIVTERSEKHGEVWTSFNAIANMWTAYINGCVIPIESIATVRLSAADVCNMLIHLKQVRSVLGDHENMENYVDACGYAALSALLAIAHGKGEKDERSGDQDRNK